MAESHIVGCILGTAVGDALGLPYEGLSRKRAQQLLGPPGRYRFLLGHGMVSDDTEHTCLVAQSLIAANGNRDLFLRDFARRLRWWFAALPAGIGRATARSCFKLCFGSSPESSGVFSAGNGPAMRAAILGAALDDPSSLVEFVLASTRITHVDPKAEHGAIAVAWAAFHARQTAVPNGQLYVDQLAEIVGPAGDELVILLSDVVSSIAAGESTLEFAVGQGMSRGVSGYSYDTVPVAIHAWLSHPQDYRAAVTAVIECGGDTDTTAAIVGGIVGTSAGEAGIPKEWIAKLCDWPCSVAWMRRLAKQLAASLGESQPQKPLALNFVALFLRNIVFLVVVLFHGYRRLLPPY